MAKSYSVVFLLWLVSYHDKPRMHKLTIDLTNDMLEEIKRYKNITRKQNIEDTVKELIM